MYVYKRLRSSEPVSVEVPRETQRFVIALVLILGFLASFTAIFILTRDTELARSVLAILAGVISTIIGYFFGSRSAEVRHG
ncbi:MAG: hypothetical protein QXO15_03285 [Nitrososphaerota archaeon]